jgi:hypothetical protein
VEVVEAEVVEVEVVEAEVVVEYSHPDHHKQLDKMYLRPEVRSKQWDNSHESSQEIEVRQTILLMNSTVTYNLTAT